MWRHLLPVMALGLLVVVGAAACDKGPMQRRGEKVDRATGQDEFIGTGPLEQVGKNLDKAVKGLKE
jgi:hypothetical protein